MSDANPDVGALFNDLVRATDPARQKALLDTLKTVPGIQYLDVVALALPLNPFLELPPDDRLAFGFKHRLNDLSVAKQAARDAPGTRVCVFCLPKSGSSFTQTAIQASLPTSFVHLTSHGNDISGLGMSGREQELDELAILYSIFRTRGSFVAQHHTRCTPYLCSLLRSFNIRPIVTMRNIFDAMISADEMFVNDRRTGSTWVRDQFTVPLDYENRDLNERMVLLASTLGIWGVSFYLNWKRCERAGLVRPLWLIYETDILDKALFRQRLAEYLGMDGRQSQRLADYVATPVPKKSRMNVGVTGRGANVPPEAKAVVLNYARLFRNELRENDRRILFGEAALGE